jgi:hypothetical protein
VDGETKRRIEDAAKAKGVSMTTFVTEAAVREAQRTKPIDPRRHFHGVPTFFRACCAEAAQGGTGGYASAGWHLANGVESLHDDPDEVMDELRDLVAAARRADRLDIRANRPLNDADRAVLRWFDKEFAKCMALVPARRRQQFLRGIMAADEEGGLD